MSHEKARVLIVGMGGVGTMAAYALETGGKAAVTAVMRSNFDAVHKHGIDIDSIEHGHDIKGWRPTTGKSVSVIALSSRALSDADNSHAAVRKTVPNVAEEGLPPFDFILVTTKNIPDIPPTVADIIAPAVTPVGTVIVLSQNGINIEKPIVPRFPRNPIISGVSYIGATEKSHGKILHDDADAQRIGPFSNPQVPSPTAEEAARRYVSIYNPNGKLDVVFDNDVSRVRWRKLVYNASFNPIAAILRMDTPRMRMSQHIVDDLIRPVMIEVMKAAQACGVHDLPADLPERLIRDDPIDSAFKPSMCQDIEKGNLMEIENIVGEPLRAGESKGVSMPTLRTIYGLLKGLQLQTLEAKGKWEPRFEPGNPYQ
ncbi:2-dehydropantoate 2-reductase [Tolypocladium paradoxum]|uniref:2-dehydropantoate 2-reductase n=1 Tax=Tolypocladium paradoxum TaxID=94208 RepID=A0A2S4L310_9HYPO|nr:2-dehydropantoate 2-reductase [Tolypocladium paradoxum]